MLLSIFIVFSISIPSNTLAIVNITIYSILFLQSLFILSLFIYVEIKMIRHINLRPDGMITSDKSKEKKLARLIKWNGITIVLMIAWLTIVVFNFAFYKTEIWQFCFFWFLERLLESILSMVQIIGFWSQFMKNHHSTEATEI